MRRIATTCLILTAFAGLAACSSAKDKPAPVGSLTQHLTMIGADGKRYGTAEIDPVGGGRLYDMDGRLIGYITAPTQ